MGHVLVEDETITLVATLRHNEMMALRVCEGRGQERRNVLACGVHCLGPKLRGAITFEKIVVRAAWRRASGPLSIQFESLVGRQMTRPSPTKNGRSRLIERPSK